MRRCVSKKCLGTAECNRDEKRERGEERRSHRDFAKYEIVDSVRVDWYR